MCEYYYKAIYMHFYKEIGEKNMEISERLRLYCKKDINKCTDREIYEALLLLVKDMANERKTDSRKNKKKLYYISAEFLIGKLLSNNLIFYLSVVISLPPPSRGDWQGNP